jgi:hypothetical protein
MKIPVSFLVFMFHIPVYIPVFYFTFLIFSSWYTDNGLFLTSGRDGKLKVWDPNTQLPIEEFAGKASFCVLGLKYRYLVQFFSVPGTGTGS